MTSGRDPGGAEPIAWVDGEIGPARSARIPLLDHGFLFGDGIFEGIRLTERGIFRFEDHMARLATAGRAVGIEPTGGFERVREVARETTRIWGTRPGYLRLIVSRGVGALGIDPASCDEPRIVCIAAGPRRSSEVERARGLALITSSLRRPTGDVLDPRVKSLNYLNNVLAKREANLRGADDALVLNARGLVAEASATNVFVVKDERISTPPVSDGALEGVTRRTILELGAQLGLETSERSLGRFDLFAADAVFLTGSRAGVVAVGSLDGSMLETGARPLLDRIARTFEEKAIELSTPVD